MKKNLLIGLATLSFVLVLTSCGKVPQTEIDAATAALDAAKTAQADAYLPEQFVALQDSLNAILATIETEKSKMFKNFGDAPAKLSGIAEQAQQIAGQVEAKKAEVKSQADTLMVQVKLLSTENSKLVIKAPKGKEGAAALDLIKTDIATADSTLSEASALIAKGDFIQALDKAKSANDISLKVNGELKGAIDKTK